VRNGTKKIKKRVAELNELDHHEEDDYHQEGDGQNQEEGDRVQGRQSPRKG
jgi:hypothetical protein